MYTEKEALEVIRRSNQKQRDFMNSNEDEMLFDVPRKLMTDNIVAIDWLVKYIDNHCPPTI